MKRLHLLPFIILTAIFSACTNSHTRFYTSDIEEDTLTIKIERFDRDIFQLDTVALAGKYGDFIKLYAYNILNLRHLSELPNFTTDSGIVALHSDVDTVYASCTDVESTLTEAFRYFHLYFPQKLVPRCMFHISGFNQAMVVTDSILSASVEQYLGSDYEPYQYVAYAYEIPFMTPQMLPLDMMYAWTSSSFPETLSGDNLLDFMIYQGKLIYLQRVFFPDSKEYELLGYTKEQYDWCRRYEANIWSYIMENREIFSTDWRVYTKYISPAPFTSGLSQESPGRIGVFIGYMIVKSYMDNNSDVTLPQLMQRADSREFLQKAAYRP